jgi:hypothetical protein
VLPKKLFKHNLNDNLFYFTTIGIYLALNITLLLRHEPWRDEAQAWLLVRDVKDFTTLFHMMGYEGHPFLWHLLLWLPARLGLSFFTIKLINLGIITSSLVIFLYASPFKKRFKIPVVFGYYFFFEYGIIARSYSLSALLILILAAIYPYRLKKPIVFSLLIVLFANTSVYCFFISGFLLIIFLRDLKKERQLVNGKNLASTFIMLIGFGIVMLQVMPPADLSPLLKKWHLFFHLKKYLDSIYLLMIATFFQVPFPQLGFWNSQLLYNETFKFSGIIILISTSIALPKRVPLLIYLMSAAIILIIHLFKYNLTTHHFGQLFFMFIFCLWISRYYGNKIEFLTKLNHKVRNFSINLFKFKISVLNLILLSVLTLNIVASGIAFYFDYRYDFSPGKSIAEYLKRQKYIREDILIAFHPSSVAASVLPYLNKTDRFYYLEYEDFGTYMIWNEAYEAARKLDLNQLLTRTINGLKLKKYRKLLLILDRNIDLIIKVEKMLPFTQAIVDSEHLYIYEINLTDGLPAR